MTRKVLSYLMALSLGLIVGCGSDEPQQENTVPEQPPSAAEYMNDSAFREKLAIVRTARDELSAQRAKLVERLNALHRRAKEQTPDASDEAILSALGADPEWISLTNRLAQLDVAYNESREQSLKIVRERLVP